MEQVLIISDHIFADSVSVIFTDDINESIKLQCDYQKIKPERYLVPKHTNAVVCFVDELEYVATWAIFDINRVDAGIIVHEVEPIVFRMLRERMISHSIKTDEVFAYSNQWFFNKIHNFWLSLNNENGDSDTEQSA